MTEAECAFKDLTEKFPAGLLVNTLEGSKESRPIRGGMREVVRVGLGRPKARSGKCRQLGVYVRRPGSSFRGVWWPASRLGLIPEAE